MLGVAGPVVGLDFSVPMPFDYHAQAKFISRRDPRVKAERERLDKLAAEKTAAIEQQRAALREQKARRMQVRPLLPHLRESHLLA